MTFAMYPPPFAAGSAAEKPTAAAAAGKLTSTSSGVEGVSSVQRQAPCSGDGGPVQKRDCGLEEVAYTRDGAYLQDARQEAEDMDWASADEAEGMTYGSVPLHEGADLTNVDPDPDVYIHAASRGEERFDYMPLEEDGLQFRPVATVLGGADAANGSVLTDLEERRERSLQEQEEAKMALDLANFAPESSSAFQAAVCETIDQSAQYAQEEAGGQHSAIKLESLPPSALPYSGEVEMASGDEPVLGFVHDDFDVRGEDALSPEETQFIHSTQEDNDGLLVASETTESDKALYAFSPGADYVHKVSNGLDALPTNSWDAISEQESYIPPAQEEYIVLSSVAAISQMNGDNSFRHVEEGKNSSHPVTAVTQENGDNIYRDLEEERYSRHRGRCGSESSKCGDTKPPKMGKRKRDSSIYGARDAPAVTLVKEKCNGGAYVEDGRASSAAVPSFFAVSNELRTSEELAPSNDFYEVGGDESERNAAEQLDIAFNVTSSDCPTNTPSEDTNRLTFDARSGLEVGGIAVWVKWRGKWEAAIRCRVSDCPAATLKARPSYSKKKYVVVFFPPGRIYSWVDVQNTCPISENPTPLLVGTHASGRESVSDENLPRRKMLLKLGEDMLDISDRLHIKAVVESSQNVNAWKAFAKEAAAATGYAELGLLLVRLHLTVAPIYVKPGWMERRHENWKMECIKAASAADLQKLTKELVNAVLWGEVLPLWNEEQPELGSEWRRWKGDAFDDKESEDDRDKNGSNQAGTEFGTPRSRQIPAGSGPKRFKEQARARRQSQLYPGTPEYSPKLCKVHTISGAVPSAQGGSSFGVASTAIRSSPLQYPHLGQDKKAEMPRLRLPFNSGLCSAFLKKKERRCNRLAKEAAHFCGKHKYLAHPNNVSRDLSAGGLAWESGLCSAAIGSVETGRCERQTCDGIMFCEEHIYLARNQGHTQDGRKSEDAPLSSLLTETRCSGITGRGVQCTHKPKEKSHFCVKHSAQGITTVQDNEGAQNLPGASEGSASKRAKTPQIEPQSEAARSHASPPSIPNVVAQSGNHLVSSQAPALMQRGSAAAAVEVKANGDDDGALKRKFINSFFINKAASSSVAARFSKGTESCLVKASGETRCLGRTMRNDEQCSFRARPGRALCSKHFLAIKGQRKRQAVQDPPVVKDPVPDAKRLLETYLTIGEGVPTDPACATSRDRLLKWAKAEASQEFDTAEKLFLLVRAEMAKLEAAMEPKQIGTSSKAPTQSALPVTGEGSVEVQIAGTVQAAEELTSVTCGICDLAFPVKADLCRHWTSYHRKDVTVFVKGYSCRQCGGFYKRKHMVRRHWKTWHASVPVQNSNWDAICSICRMRLEGYDRLLEHVCSEHPDKLTSPSLKSSASMRSVGVPVEVEAVETVKCDQCGEMSCSHVDPSRHQAGGHKSSDTDGNGLTTSIVSPEEGGPEEDTAGVDSPSASHMLGCPICGKKFSCASDLERHVAGDYLVCNNSGVPRVEATTVTGDINSSDLCLSKLQLPRKFDEKVGGSVHPVVGTRSKRMGRPVKHWAVRTIIEKENEGRETLVNRMKHAMHNVRINSMVTKQLNRGRLHGARHRRTLYSLTKGGQIHDTPDDLDLLETAQSVCCESKLVAALQKGYARIPDHLSTTLARVCKAANVKLEWLADGYLCDNGCNERSITKGNNLDPRTNPLPVSGKVRDGAEMKETINVVDKKWSPLPSTSSGLTEVKAEFNGIILCEDLSRGQEPVPVVCVVDQDVVNSWARMHKDGGSSSSDALTPWESFKYMDTFKYITQRVLDPSLGLDPENYKVGCSCEGVRCLPGSCDHVNFFDTDNVDAVDIYGEPMTGRFPYNKTGCIILEEGYLVYECNSSCHCQSDCQNRVLQKGVTVTLEVFKTLHKGWAVRAAQAIPRGTFVCEYLGEVLRDQDANKRGERYDQKGCSYLYDIDAHIDTTGKDGRSSKPFVIDATSLGNVARFINHSCAPNLVNYQVLVDSMDCQLAHIGLFASRDIANGEELAYNYRYKLLPGRGCPCHCGAASCRGRLY